MTYLKDYAGDYLVYYFNQKFTVQNLPLDTGGKDSFEFAEQTPTFFVHQENIALGFIQTDLRSTKQAQCLYVFLDDSTAGSAIYDRLGKVESQLTWNNL